MGFTLGGFIAEYRQSIQVPRPLRERYDDPSYDGEEDPDTSTELLAALYSGKVHRTEEIVGIEKAASREATVPYVAFDGRCVIVFDRWAAVCSDFEVTGPLSGTDLRLAELTARAEVARCFVFSLDSISDTYAFAVFENGVPARRWAFIPTDGEPIRIDEGTPLPTEPRERDAHGETRIDAACRTILGKPLTHLASQHAGPVYECQRAYG